MSNRPGPTATGAGQTRWAIIGLCAALIFAAGAVWWTQRGDASPVEPPSSSPTSSPTETPSGTVQPADGCLGGPDPERAVLVAHDNAPLTGDGAAAFLATYARWHMLVPKGSPVADIADEVWADDLDAPSKKMASLKDIQDQGQVAESATFVGKHYRVEYFDGSRAVVAMTIDLTNGGPSVAANAGSVVVAEAVAGRWVYAGIDHQRFEELAGADHGAAFRAELDKSGIPFQEGC